MKVLLIDPWCYNGSNLYYYTTGLSEALSTYSQLTLVTDYDCELPQNTKYLQRKAFFRFSNRMQRGKMRSIIRGVEYFIGYISILRLVIREKYDVIHIEWPLLLKMDCYLFSLIKPYTGNLVLTAHNILPHSTGKKYLNDMRKIYHVVDTILVHGNAMANDFKNMFPEERGKVMIQNHGVYMNHNTDYNLKKISEKLNEFVMNSSRIYLFFGIIHKDKGIERLVKAWHRIEKKKGSKLIIAGRIDDDYGSFSQIKDAIQDDDIYTSFEYIDDNTANYLFKNCNVVLLPYLEGSMSGVAFTCAEFMKPIIATNFGVISEYLKNEETGYICENSDDAFLEIIQDVESNISNERLKMMGIKHKEYIYKNYSWDEIAMNLVEGAYKRKILQ